MIPLDISALTIGRYESADTRLGGIVQPTWHQDAAGFGSVDYADGARGAHATEDADLAADLDLADAAGHADVDGLADAGRLAYAAGNRETAPPAGSWISLDLHL